MQLPALIVPLRYSPAMWMAFLATHLLPLSAVWITRLPPAVAGGVTLLLLLSAGRFLYRARLWRGRRMLLHPAGHIQIQEALEQAPAEVRLVTGSCDLGWLVILCWQPVAGGRVERFPLARDGMPAEGWRKLRISLRWRTLAAPV